jgi:hypothetical protein
MHWQPKRDTNPQYRPFCRPTPYVCVYIQFFVTEFSLLLFHLFPHFAIFCRICVPMCKRNASRNYDTHTDLLISQISRSRKQQVASSTPACNKKHSVSSSLLYMNTDALGIGLITCWIDQHYVKYYYYYYFIIQWRSSPCRVLPPLMRFRNLTLIDNW